MTKTIDHISINNFLWIQLKPHLISFGFKGLPTDTHFTIGFDDRSPDINFHITKNVTNPTDKPKITIVRINKILLEEIAPSLTLAMLKKFLRPLNSDELKSKNDCNVGFISFDKLEHSDTYSLTEQKLIDSFKDISKFRNKTRLKIEGDIEKRLESFATSEDIHTSFLNHMVELPSEFQTPIDGGMIISEDNMLPVIRINNKWFTLRTDLNPIDLLTVFVNHQLANLLIWKTKRALVSLKYATSFADTKHLNKPIRLMKIHSKDTTTKTQ